MGEEQTGIWRSEVGEERRGHTAHIPGKTRGGESSTSRNQKSRCPLTGWASPRERVRRGVGKFLFGPAVGIVRSKQTVLSSRMPGGEEQKDRV